MWGVLSFFDKIANGIAIVLIQREHPSYHPTYYYRWMMSIIPGAGTIAAILAIIAMIYFMKIEDQRRQSYLVDHDYTDEAHREENYSSTSRAVDNQTMPRDTLAA